MTIFHVAFGHGSATFSSALLTRFGTSVRKRARYFGKRGLARELNEREVKTKPNPRKEESTMLVKFNQNPFAAIDRVFEDVFRDVATMNAGFMPNAMRVDISEDEKNIYIEAEMPGLKKEDVKISIEDDILTIRGERKQETEEKKKNYHRVERYYGSFSRSFTLGENIDRENIDAKYEEGVLRLTLPKVEPVKNVKEIAVK